jgi:hypothetical protein
MSLCLFCGLEVWGGNEICSHYYLRSLDWAKSNKIWCDYFHRGVEIQRAPEESLACIAEGYLA